MKHYTIKSLAPHMSHNQLCKVDDDTVGWFLEGSDFWTAGAGWDRYFTEEDIERLEPTLKAFVKSEFCEVSEL